MTISFKEDEVYDLHVNNGRLLEHFHEVKWTYQTEMIKYKVPNAFVEISPELSKDRIFMKAQNYD